MKRKSCLDNAILLIIVGAIYFSLPASAESAANSKYPEQLPNILKSEQKLLEEFQPYTLKCPEMSFLMEVLAQRQGRLSDRRKHIREELFHAPHFSKSELEEQTISDTFEIKPRYTKLGDDFPAIWPKLRIPMMNFTGSDEELIRIADRIESVQINFRKLFLKYLRADRQARPDLEVSLSRFGLDSAQLRKLKLRAELGLPKAEPAPKNGN